MKLLYEFHVLFWPLNTGTGVCSSFDFVWMVCTRLHMSVIIAMTWSISSAALPPDLSSWVVWGSLRYRRRIVSRGDVIRNMESYTLVILSDRWLYGLNRLDFVSPSVNKEFLSLSLLPDLISYSKCENRAGKIAFTFLLLRDESFHNTKTLTEGPVFHSFLIFPGIKYQRLRHAVL